MDELIVCMFVYVQIPLQGTCLIIFNNSIHICIILLICQIICRSIKSGDVENAFTKSKSDFGFNPKFVKQQKGKAILVAIDGRYL